MNICEKNHVELIKKRIHRLVDGHGTALSAVALRSSVEIGTVKALYEKDGFSKRTISKQTARKLDAGLDALESSQGMVKRCSKCGRELPLGRFTANKRRPDGLDTRCAECVAKGRKESKNIMNNNTEKAMTAEMVQRVKDEDKRDVESKFMAPYFGLTPKQLDEVRKGAWDKLLLTPKVPERADTVLAAVEALRGEVAELRREVELTLIEMGVDVGRIEKMGGKA